MADPYGPGLEMRGRKPPTPVERMVMEWIERKALEAMLVGEFRRTPILRGITSLA